METLGYIISTDLSEIIAGDTKKLVNTINPHSYCVARKDELFQKALKGSDFLLPDGIGIVLAVRFLRGKRIQKIAGADVHAFLLKEADKKRLKVFYLGASESTLEKIRIRLAKEYPHVSVETYSPPYKPVFSEEDNAAMIERVNEFVPDYLFVGMTAPKQEKWAFENMERLNAGVICSIGAVFDFYAGTIKRPHPFWIKIGLEWLIRFVKEPRRLYERNLISMPKFLWYVFIAKFTGK